MSTNSLPTRSVTAERSTADPRRWLGLAVIALSTLMVVLDNSIVTIALPDAQADLGISDTNRQWVVTAYALAFGGLLLIGGRVADFTGRKRAFIIGLIGFAAASAVGGIAPDSAILIAARALQGAFAALLAPAALSLLVETFPEPRERAKAFGVYGAVQGAGGALGLVVGGMLTEYIDWRWCLLVNLPIAVVALLMAIPTLRESRASGDRRYDVPGAVLITAALISFVAALTFAATPGLGWRAPVTLILLPVGVVLVIAFFVVEGHTTHPLLPLRIIADRTRGGALLSGLFVFAGMFGMFLFLTYYFQVNLHYSPLQAGFAFLPFSGGIILTSTLAASLLPRLGGKVLLAGGTALGAIGIVLLTGLGTHSTYVGGVLPTLIIMSIGLGSAFVPLSALALNGVASHDAGVASALVNVTQQVGGALGTAVLNTVYLSAISFFIVTHRSASATGFATSVAGLHVAFTVSGALLAAASVVAVVFIVRTKKTTSTPSQDDAPE